MNNAIPNGRFRKHIFVKAKTKIGILGTLRSLFQIEIEFLKEIEFLAIL